MTAQIRLFLFVGFILGASWLTLALIGVRPGESVREIVGLGYFLGSLFAHANLAAAWAALGPGALRWRLPLSFAWIVTLAAAVFTNYALHDGPDYLVFVLGGCYVAQWVLVQIPLWGLKAGFRLHLLHTSVQSSGPQKWQFGIRQLLIITTIVGVIFGLARLVIPSLSAKYSLVDNEASLFFFLAASAIVVSLPLLLAALLERGTSAGILIAIVLIGVGTYLEVPVLRTTGYPDKRPDSYDLLSINVSTSLFTLVVAGTIRLCGYRLTRLQPATP